MAASTHGAKAPATPRLMRAINERAAPEALFESIAPTK
jgi:hypothetical protein